LLGIIGTGIVIGVSSGLILSLSSWGLSYLQDHNEKQDQIKYLASVIDRDRGLIYDEATIQRIVENAPVETSRENVRKTFYVGMYRELESVFANRASQLSYDEIQEIKKPLVSPDLYPEIALNDAGYDLVFGKLESIEWLNLPPRHR